MSATLFQSTLPQGKWHHTPRGLLTGLVFQSTLPQGKWLIQKMDLTHTSRISIHTSAREVTHREQEAKAKERNFNPHFRKGSDLHRMAKKAPSKEFQSTLPQGKWHMPRGGRGYDPVFQSTLPQGKWRKIPAWKYFVKFISIHTSAREVTYMREAMICKI